MKFSEAIRMGSLLKEQAIGVFVETDRHENIIRTCAISAAFDAIGKLDELCGAEESFAVEECIDYYFPISENKIPKYLLSCDHKADDCRDTIRDMVAHLNDNLEWSREQIADLVEQIEQYYEEVDNHVYVEHSHCPSVYSA